MIEFLLRQGSEADGAAIAALLAANSMEADIPAEEFLVAEVESRLVGLARLEGEGEEVYIRPVVVDSGWQGKGLGRSLVQQVSNGLPAVHVIARGEATSFMPTWALFPWPGSRSPRVSARNVKPARTRRTAGPGRWLWISQPTAIL